MPRGSTWVMAQGTTRAIKRNACAMSKEDFNVNSFLRDQHLSREETIVLSSTSMGIVRNERLRRC